MHEKTIAIWGRISGRLLPFLERVLPPMQEHHRKVAMILEFVRPEDIVRQRWAATGRPPVDLSLMARAFVAKMELNLDTTKRLIETLKSDEVLRSPKRRGKTGEGKKHGFKSFANRSRPPSIGRSPKTVIGAESETAWARPNIGRDSSSI